MASIKRHVLSHTCGCGFAVLWMLVQSVTAAQGTLSEGAMIEKELRPRETHTYAIILRAGDYVEAEIVERGINVMARLYDAAGAKAAEEDTPNGNFDTSDFQTIVQTSGTFRLELTGLSKDPGRYQLRIKNVHLATGKDEADIKAHETEREASRLRDERTAESRHKAIEKFLEVLAYRVASGDRQNEARAAADLGRLYFYLDDRGTALEYLQHALELFRSVDDKIDEAIVLNNLGGVYQDMGEPQTALDYFTQSLPGLQSLGDKYREAAANHNLGWSYQTLGEFRKASDLYRQALPLWGNAFGEAQTLNNLGLTYYQLGDIERSIEYFEKALALRRTVKDARGEAETLANLGWLRAGLNDARQARDLFQQSLTVARQAENRVSQSRALLGLAMLAPTIVTPEQAFEYVDKALNLIRSFQDRRMEGDGLFTLGKLHRLRGEVELSIQTYKEALALHIAADDRQSEANTMLELAGVTAEKGNLEEASSWNEKALDVVESLRGRVAEPRLRTSFLASTQSYYDHYIDLLMRLHQREPSSNYAVLALEASERARAQGLLDALADQPAQIRQGIDPALLERERQLQTALNIKDQQWRNLLSAPSANAGAADAKRELDRLLDELSQLQGEIQSRSPRYANLTQPRPVVLTDLQREFDDDTLLLEYWLGEKRSFLWAVTPDSVTTYTLPRAENIEDTARQFFAALTNRSTPQPASDANVARLASRLSEMLLAPVTDRLENKNLVVVSHGALQYLPFAALPPPLGHRRRTTTPATLLDEHEIVSLPSASVLAPLRAEAGRQRNPEKMVAILADPVFSLEDPRFAQHHAFASSASSGGADEQLERSLEESGLGGLRRLRFSRVEADAIASLVGKENHYEAVDFQASRATALSAELGQYRILHFATHGLANSVHPELSGLVFSTVDQNGHSQDGLLRLHEIFNMSLNAELVVLSACQTALGKDIKGEGLVGLTRGFMYAGTPRVVASLWNVEDRATAELMKRFYEGMLKRQLRPSAALREAQLALQHDKRWSSPFYWAGFILQGEWR